MSQYPVEDQLREAPSRSNPNGKQNNMVGYAWTSQERAALIYLRAWNHKAQQTWNLVCSQFNLLWFSNARSKESLQSQYKYLSGKHEFSRDPRAELKYLRDNGMVEDWMSEEWIDSVLIDSVLSMRTHLLTKE
jgi:hypothetical protein